ncbi:hypothetical protein AMAG_00806 [Allomyces macrogynus ATCC 38327]|uniref:Uncharacterized protein n=1 Tax=Allomyces macrogynus (strain ATCC 38327) TaxID=578462 RepID=A0A0L0RWY7_ALLM3|nr:hypothetical protein AMAG_00806 [Allomyces macrogynus ATCC 38327]|eukprot:KNE54858.1 hypothetical protein AMAG_00806 [Allomyces macrogynus ATCC 38327]
MSKESLPPFGHALSGAAGALLALTITYPLDIIKTRLQVQASGSSKKDGAAKADAANAETDTDAVPEYSSTWDALTKIVKSEGLAGLYAGLPAGLLGTASSNFTYFYYYTFIREWYKRRSPAPASTAVELLLGAIAGALSQLTTIPVAVVITRQQTTPSSRRMSFKDTWNSIVREEGVTGLWKGLKPSMVLVSNPAITYGMFERLKTSMLRGQDRPLKSWEVFFIGAVAKSLATVVTYPYIMAKVRLQWKPTTKEQMEDPNLQYKGAIDVLQKVLKTDGFTGWYNGMQAQITKAVFSQALLFMLKDKIDQYTILVFALLRLTQSQRA